MYNILEGTGSYQYVNVFCGTCEVVEDYSVLFARTPP